MTTFLGVILCSGFGSRFLMGLSNLNFIAVCCILEIQYNKMYGSQAK